MSLLPSATALLLRESHHDAARKDSYIRSHMSRRVVRVDGIHTI